MIVGCKHGCLCNDINKEYCCIECEKFNSCKDSCPRNDIGITKENILKICVDSYRVNS